MDSGSASGQDAYGALAPYYDDFTADYAYDRWLGELDALAVAGGLRGRRVLDVGCGTGKSFLPLLDRGYEVTACDLSPSMVELARAKVRPLRHRIFAADMRALPEVGRFDLITCLDDAVNHLLTDADLVAAMRSLAARLEPGGLAVFDVNSLRTYREQFAGDFAFDTGRGIEFRFAGSADPDFAAGGVAAATIEAEVPDERGQTRRMTSRHRQRHHPRERIAAACSAAGLDCVAVHGQLPGGRVMGGADETRHTKIVYLVAKPDDRC